MSKSDFGWLAFDQAASDEVDTMLKALAEPGMLDPLGLGSLRDAIANQLAPGVSTIQTRLRYFLFIPWILRRIERDRVPVGQFAKRLRHDEARLIDCLRPLGPGEGTIGYNAGIELQRLPSEVYWGGLGSWEIRRLDLSISEYGRRLAAFSPRPPERDNDGNVISPHVSMWALSVQPPEGDQFLSVETTFDLTRPEANQIVQRIELSHSGSLLAQACAHPGLFEHFEVPWEALDRPTARAKLSPATQALVLHARNVSEMTLMPQLAYNVHVARRSQTELHRDTHRTIDEASEQAAALAAIIEGRHAELAKWLDNIDEFWTIADPGGDVPEETRAFIERMSEAVLEAPSKFVDDVTIARDITMREHQLKGQRARLTSRAALESFPGGLIGGQMDFRWSNVRRYLADLAAATGTGA